MASSDAQQSPSLIVSRDDRRQDDADVQMSLDQGESSCKVYKGTVERKTDWKQTPIRANSRSTTLIRPAITIPTLPVANRLPPLLPCPPQPRVRISVPHSPLTTRHCYVRLRHSEAAPPDASAIETLLQTRVVVPFLERFSQRLLV